MLGCATTLTDVADVLSLLRANVAANFSTAAWARAVALRERFSSIDVRELDWTKPEQLAGFGQFDYIIGKDCVYHEALAVDLLRVVLHCCGAKTYGAHL
jgi:Lysine methyltransferase